MFLAYEGVSEDGAEVFSPQVFFFLMLFFGVYSVYNTYILCIYYIL
jgi:hypothetical protein